MEVCNLADDTNFYACNKKFRPFLNNTLEHTTHLAIEWFVNNYMQLNQEKTHVFLGIKIKLIAQG